MPGHFNCPLCSRSNRFGDSIEVEILPGVFARVCDWCAAKVSDASIASLNGRANDGQRRRACVFSRSGVLCPIS